MAVTQKQYETVGLGYLERIKKGIEEPKKYKPLGSFKDKIVPEVKYKPEPPKVQKFKPAEEVTIARPSYVGGEGGLQSLGAYAEKQGTSGGDGKTRTGGRSTAEGRFAAIHDLSAGGRSLGN